MIIKTTLPFPGSSSFSTPVKCRMKNPGQRMRTFHKPTRPKKSGMLILLSSPIRFFIMTA